VGYTNAGKSTLFNRMTHAGTYVANQLFATLDTTARKLYLPGGSPCQVVLSDTVGFIRHLPHSLVAAFRSTLEETAQADLLLHVVDVNSPERNDQVAEVNKVLAEVGAQDIPQIVIYNKIDLQGLAADVRRDEYGNIAAIHLSAKTGAGIEVLRDALTAVRDTPIQQKQAEAWHPLNDH
jgi:GTP-binding protein HflX